MESKWSSQPSVVAARSLVGTRRDNTEFASTLKVSERAEQKLECKDVQQAEGKKKNKTFLLLVTLNFCSLKALFWSSVEENI